MKQTNASPKHSSRIYYLGTLAMLASMLLLPHRPGLTGSPPPACPSPACLWVPLSAS